MAPFLLVNPRSGDASPSAAELVEEAGRRGVDAHVLRPDDDASELARSADADVLGVAGGDGSLAAVATAALERGLPFVVVPFGTRNHFARDVGLDRDDPLGALAAFGDGVERRVDVGRVGDRVFLNNVSLGLYAGLVHRREQHRRRGEALAGARALWRLARERHRLRARIDGEEVLARILFVGNNRYDVSLYTVGERPALDEGCLHLYAARGWLPRAWSEQVAPEFRVEVPHGRRVRVAIDGEPVVLETEEPLAFRSDPRALRVLLPADESAT